MPPIGSSLTSGQDHERKLQPLGFVNTHDSHGVEILFRKRAFALFLNVEDSLLKLVNRFLKRGQAFFAQQLSLLPQLL